MIYLYAFLIGGAICAIGQILMDTCKLLPVYITSIFVCLGSLFSFGNLYDKLIDFAGAGATIPISSFGHSLTHAAVEQSMQDGYIGIITGMFSLTSAGIVAAIIFAFIMSLIFKPRG